MRGIAPVIDVPAPVLEAEMIEARVDEVEVAPRHQVDVLGRAIGDIAYESVCDDHDDFRRMPRRNFGETG